MGLVDMIKEMKRYTWMKMIYTFFCKRKGSDKLIVVFPAITKQGDLYIIMLTLYKM